MSERARSWGIQSINQSLNQLIRMKNEKRVCGGKGGSKLVNRIHCKILIFHFFNKFVFQSQSMSLLICSFACFNGTLRWHRIQLFPFAPLPLEILSMFFQSSLFLVDTTLVPCALRLLSPPCLVYADPGIPSSSRSPSSPPLPPSPSRRTTTTRRPSPV